MSDSGDPEEQVSDEARAEAARLEDLYGPDARKTVIVPGTDGMVAGTAFADQVDDPDLTNRPPKEVPGHSEPAGLEDAEP